MSNVKYLKRLKRPAGDKLLFTKQGNDIISEEINLKFRIELSSQAPDVMDTVRLKFTMQEPTQYVFSDDSKEIVTDYENVSEDFDTETFSLNVKVIDPDAPLELPVMFVVTVMDVDEGIPFPLDGRKGLYKWNPVPPFNNLVPANFYFS